MSGSEHHKSQWALLVGINRYPNFAPRGQLSGCINDIELMRQVLEESFNFPENHIALLADEQATREGILTAMKDLVAQVGQDDIVVFHYCGHGSQMTDIEGDAPDGLDQTIVPYDSGRAPYENRDIKDAEIYLWLKELTAKTSFITLIFDCCHSGTIVGDVLGGKVRQIEGDFRSAEEMPPSPIPVAARGLLDVRRGSSSLFPFGERYVLFSSCSRDEKSAEVEEPTGVHHGVLTFFLAQELLKAEAGATYRDVFEVMAPRISARFTEQHPQFQGDRDREIFGFRWIEPVAFMMVLERSVDEFVLGGGAVCGITEGSQWRIYPAGTKVISPDVQPVGVVVLIEVRSVTSKARLLSETHPGVVVPGLRAVEEIGALERRMPVEVVASPGQDVQVLLDGLDASMVLRRAQPNGYAKVRVNLLAPRSVVAKDTPMPMLGSLREETWVVVCEDGQLLMPIHPRFELGIRLLLDNLEKFARYCLMIDLRNDASALKGKVDFELFRKAPFGLEMPELDADNRMLFYEGERLAMRIVNRHDAPLFVYILDFDLARCIRLVYPAPGAEDSLLPGKSLEVGVVSGHDIDLVIPNEFPFGSTAPGEEVEGIETVKLFLTTLPAEFQPILQCKAAFGGGGYHYRDPRNRSMVGESEDWTTLTRSFWVRRRAAFPCGGEPPRDLS